VTRQLLLVIGSVSGFMVVFTGLVWFTSTLGYHAATGLYRFTLRRLRAWHRWRQAGDWLSDEALQEWIESSGELVATEPEEEAGDEVGDS